MKQIAFASVPLSEYEYSYFPSQQYADQCLHEEIREFRYFEKIKVLRGWFLKNDNYIK